MYELPPEMNNLTLKGRVKPWFFVTFNILKHIFPEKFHWISSCRSEDMNINSVNMTLSILAIFTNFPQFYLKLPCYKETNGVSL